MDGQRRRPLPQLGQRARAFRLLDAGHPARNTTPISSFAANRDSHAWHVVGKNAGASDEQFRTYGKGQLVQRCTELQNSTARLPRTYQSKAQQVFLDGERDVGENQPRNSLLPVLPEELFADPVSKPEIEPYLEILKNMPRQNLGSQSREEAFFLGPQGHMLVSPDFPLPQGRKKKSPDKPIELIRDWPTVSLYFLWVFFARQRTLSNLAKEATDWMIAVALKQTSAERLTEKTLEAKLSLMDSPRVLAAARQTRHHASRIL